MYKSLTANLMVDSVDKSLIFYKEILGFEVVQSVPGKSGELQFAILAKDEQMLMLQEKGNLSEEYPILTTDQLRPSLSIYIMIDDFDTVYERLSEKHKIYVDIHTTFYGAREFAVADPNGYVLTFAEVKK